MATDNTTTLLSNVKNSAAGEISFTLKVPKGYKAYYEVLPATAKTIHNSQTVISTDYDHVKGTVDNTSGDGTITKNLSKTVKLYGNYKVRVGLGAYYNGNSSLRQSTTVKSTMYKSTNDTLWKWTQEYRDKFHNSEKVALTKSSVMLSLTITKAIDIIPKSNAASYVIGVGTNTIIKTLENTKAILDAVTNLKTNEYIGYRIVENSEDTNIKIYFVTLKNDYYTVKDKILLKTLYHSNYIPVFR